MTALLELSDVSKSFGGVTVLEGVSFDVRRGEVHALLGENGAGKSTLIKIAAGVHRPDSGVIRVNGTESAFTSPRSARDSGIAVVYQELLLFPELTVAENIFIGHAPRMAGGALDWTRMRRRARELLDDLDSPHLDVDARVGTLSVANRQRVEIAKALSQDAQVVIMDEPTRGIDVGAKAEIHALMSRLAGEGLAILMISSELPEVLGMSDRVVVMSGGRFVAEFSREEATPEAVGAAMTLVHERGAA
jgi:rhamnose transport system ATP-binding protein